MIHGVWGGQSYRSIPNPNRAVIAIGDDHIALANMTERDGAELVLQKTPREKLNKRLPLLRHPLGAKQSKGR